MQSFKMKQFLEFQMQALAISLQAEIDKVTLIDKS